MRVPQRASKRSQYYLLEEIEKRLLLSAATSTTLNVPATWEAYPQILIDNAGKDANPILGGSTTPIGLTPQQIRGAYGIDNIKFGNVTGDGSGQTIALVDAYDDPNAFSDLRAFDAAFNLPDPPSFQKLNEEGLAAPLPTTDPAGAGNDTWESEESLDIEWAHAVAPAANIILFEANDPFGDDLYITAGAAARTPGVSAVSMSFAGEEFESELSVDSTFVTPADHEGVTFFAAAGDSGIFEQGTDTVVTNYPAASPNVVAVGGTTLNVSGNMYGSESAWGEGQDSGTDPDGGGGGGISLYEPAPAYQQFLDDQSTTFRTYPDVAMEADPSTGVPVYDTFDNDASTPWFDFQIGGTSLATPLWAGVVTIANQGRVINGFGTLNGRTETLPRIYDLPGDDFHDITSGNNGYSSLVGYDLTTGRGSPIANTLVPDLAAPYIGFHVFSDTNIDGIQEAGEGGVSGVTVTLKTPGADGVIGDGDDLTIESTTTDQFGLYQFVNVPTGQYYVNFSSTQDFAFSPKGNGANPTANSIVNPLTGDSGIIDFLPTTEDDVVNAGVYQQTISINNVTVDRPHSGLAPLVFTVTLAPVNINVTDVPYTTEDGTATVANNDYIPTSGILVFPVGVTTETITVEAVGNLTIENTVEFTVVVTPPPGFLQTQPPGGVGTIVNTNFPVATVASPPPQTRSATIELTYPFVITLSAVAPFDVTVPYTTVDNSAVQSVDYLQTDGSIVFPAGTTSETVDVPVLPGTNRQLDKIFQFQLTTPTFDDSVTLGSPSIATGTILTNALPAINAVDGEVTESLTGLAYLPFDVQVTPSLGAPVTVQYVTSDGTAIAGKDYQAQSGTLTFTPGRVEQTVYVPVYRQFIAAQDKTLTFTLFNSTSNVLLIDPVATGTIHYVSLAALPFTETHRATYTDSLNQLVTVSMRGLGSGDVIFLGSESTATNAYEIVIDGTNAASSVAVSVAHGQQTSLTDLEVSSSIGTINAKTTNIVGTVTTAGISVLNLGYVEGGTLTIGGATSGQTAVLNFNRVLNGTITSAISIKTLIANAYVNTTGSPIYITAPSVGTVKVKGTFGGTISTSTIQALQAGEIEGGAVLATSSIGTITAGGIDDSTFFAGVTAGLTTLPTSTADFSNTASVIKAVHVKKGGVFSNSLIAGYKVGNVNVGKVGTVVGADLFGVSADILGSIQAVAGSTNQLVHVVDPTVSTTVDNFTVKPV